MNYAQAVATLDARGFGLKPDLSRIESLIELLDHPEKAYPVIHIAGTNGKSSTARMIGWILAAHGIVAGVYTSPHLQTVRERFLLLGPGGPIPRSPKGIVRPAEGSPGIGQSIASGYISEDDFAATMSYLKPFLDDVESRRGESISYFELTTAMAFEWMTQSVVGAGVIEAGMGGTWDATNVVQSDVAVITTVAVDHVGFLGSTPLANAREKVGIIKEGAVVVSAPQQADVMELLESTAGQKGAKVAYMGREFHLESNLAAIDGRAITVKAPHGVYEDIFVRLHGGHQGVNAAVAIASCEEFLGRSLDSNALRAALHSVQSPGRFEVVRAQPLVVLDGAHNPDGARALAATLAESFGGRSTTFVIAISKGKDIEGILDFLLPLGDRVFFTASTQKPADPQTVAGAAEGKIKESRIAPSIHAAIDEAIALSGPDDMVVVTGSLYGVGEARDHLLGGNQI